MTTRLDELDKLTNEATEGPYTDALNAAFHVEARRAIPKLIAIAKAAKAYRDAQAVGMVTAIVADHRKAIDKAKIKERFDKSRRLAKELDAKLAVLTQPIKPNEQGE